MTEITQNKFALTKKVSGVPIEYSARIINIMKASIDSDPETLILKPENIENFREETAKTVKSIFNTRQLWEDVVEACNIENLEVQVDSDNNPQEQSVDGVKTVITVIKITPKNADLSQP